MTNEEFQQRKQRLEQIYIKFQQSLAALKAEQDQIIAEIAKSLQEKRTTDIRSRIQDIAP